MKHSLEVQIAKKYLMEARCQVTLSQGINFASLQFPYSRLFLIVLHLKNCVLVNSSSVSLSEIIPKACVL